MAESVNAGSVEPPTLALTVSRPMTLGDCDRLSNDWLRLWDVLRSLGFVRVTWEQRYSSGVSILEIDL